jgi:hypothetical protein
MAVIASNTVTGTNGTVTITKTTLGSSDTISYVSGGNQVLNIENGTGSPVTVNIDGSGATTISPAGLGATVDVSSGYNITVADGAHKAVRLDSIAAYMAGTVTVTGASGAKAWITN